MEGFLAGFNTGLADSADEFHNSLYINGNHVTELVNTYYIAGYNTKTIYKIFSFMNIWRDYTTSDDIKGDSLVPVWSATLGDRQPNSTIYAKNIGHTELVTNTVCLNYISQLIGGDDTIPEQGILSQEMVFDNE